MSRSNSHRTKKRLRFSETSTLISILPKTSADRKATWYDKESMRKFKNDVWRASQEGTRASKLLKSMSQYVLEIKKHGTLKMQDMYRIRGLEHIDRDIARVLLLGRRMAIDGVLREQARQIELGVHDIARIAYMSTKYSRFSAIWSQIIAAL
eukprot:scaffold30506_cov62-Cyclotella_meneghiniana.AAC.2